MTLTFSLARALNILLLQLDVVEDLYNKFLANPEVETHVHKLRVSMRTLRSLLKFLKPFQEKEERKCINNFLRAEAQAISYLRELDVFKAEWTNIAEIAGIDSTTSPLLRRVERERAAETERVVASISVYDVRENLTCIRKSLNEWEDLHQNIFDYVVTKQSKAIDEFYDELNKLDLANYDAIHDLRKDIKQLRYVQDNFTFLDEHTSLEYEDFKALQETFGLMTDHFVNTEIIATLRENEEDPTLLEELDLFQEKSDAAFADALESLKTQIEKSVREVSHFGQESDALENE